MKKRYVGIALLIGGAIFLFNNCGKGLQSLSVTSESNSSNSGTNTSSTTSGSTTTGSATTGFSTTSGTTTGTGAATTSGTTTSGTTTSGTTTGGTTTGETGVGGGDCVPLSVPANPYRVVNPSEAGNLNSIIAGAPAGSFIVLNNGTYNLTSSLNLSKSDITLIGQTQNPDLVIIDGQNGYNGSGADTRVGELVRITGSRVTVANLTLRSAGDHVVHVSPPSTTMGSTGVVITHVKILNPGQQAVKINANGATSTVFTENGTIRCSTIMLEDSARPWVDTVATGCYTGGIDIHQSRGWTFKNNRISGFWCQSGLAEHGIHAWTGSRDTIVENNVIEDCARGIGFGLSPTGSVNARTYSDNPCGGATSVGHYGGRIVNNVVTAKDPNLFASGSKFDTGIGVENACDVLVYHNTIFSTPAPTFASIDIRFNPASGFPVRVRNNYSVSRITTRDGAAPQMGNNFISALAADFVSAATLNFRPLSTNMNAVDKGVNVGVTRDIVERPRDNMPDLGAYEH